MKRLRQQHGFLLLEVLVAVALMGIGLYVLIDSLSRCLAAARSIQKYTVSQTLLANKSYEFRVEQAQDMEEASGKFEDYPDYRWERHLEKTETDDLWLQTITVAWPERGKTATETIYEYRYIPDKPR